jgi:hypothetical protein
LSPASGETVPYATLQTIAGGVPRSFPFHQIAIHFQAPEFGDLAPAHLTSAGMLPGILVGDDWWVNGRMRSLSGCSVVEGDPGGKKLPPLPDAVAKVFAVCGKAKRTIQVPLSGAVDGAPAPVRINAEAAGAIQSIVLDYRGRMPEILQRAAMPHDLPATAEALRVTGLGVASGPKKPVLDRWFKPMGYTCQAGSGTFTLRRRTPSNLTAEVSLDVGTWSRSIVAIFRLWGLGFKATLLLPVCEKAAAGGQYPIGDGENWQRIVENLAALVAELDRTFVPQIEAAAGPSPDWYRPES